MITVEKARANTVATINREADRVGGAAEPPEHAEVIARSWPSRPNATTGPN